MRTSLEVMFTPAEFATLERRDLSKTVCVIFDVLRATSSIVTALANGASAILPVAEIPEALRIRKGDANVLLAGERNGLRIGSDLTGSTAFDLGNSPREFTRELVSGRRIAMTTTNGTRALRACGGAKKVLAASFLNLHATAERLKEALDLILVCGGTFEEAAYEDALAAGALCDELWSTHAAVSDSAQMARKLYHLEQGDLLMGLSKSRNGQRLLKLPGLVEDVAFCAQRDLYEFAVKLEKGELVIDDPIAA